ncbi:nucleotidyltransferase domain-containing protein [Streptomyces noursei]|uniref:nucleotidyltransferase domain-containing protein n=1 Tax=Streptomyces noursei TaxID=1971 RepID=UPI0036D2F0BF
MRRLQAPFGNWEPASLSEAVALFAGRDVRWWMAGGIAVELAVGRVLRPHGDLDVLVLRRDQLAVQRALAGWEWWAADPPGSLRPWSPGELLPFGVHDVWCRPGPDRPWRVQFMLDESQGTEWVSRRDARVRRPVGALGATSAAGVPFLVPEVQLYYKAKSPRPKDEVDFAAALPVLDGTQRRWLIEALTRTYGRRADGRACVHPWVARLQA